MVAITFGGGNVTNVLVNGEATGAIALPTVSGGTGTYSTYTWTSSGAGASTVGSPSTLSAKTALKAGTYYLTVTDSASATGTATYTITQNPAVVITAGSVEQPTQHGTNQTASIHDYIISGGVAPYTYAFQTDNAAAVSGGTVATSGSEIPCTHGFSEGSYSLVATDSVGGSATVTFKVQSHKGRLYHTNGGHKNIKPAL